MRLLPDVGADIAGGERNIGDDRRDRQLFHYRGDGAAQRHARFCSGVPR